MVSRRGLLAGVGALSLAGVAGCIGDSPGTPTDSHATDTADTDDTGTANATDSDRVPAGTLDVYLTAGGPALSAFASLTVDVGHLYLEETGPILPGECLRTPVPENATLAPTQTPERETDVDCLSVRASSTFDSLAIDLAELADRGMFLGRFTVPALTYQRVAFEPSGAAFDGTLADGGAASFREFSGGLSVDVDGSLAIAPGETVPLRADVRVAETGQETDAGDDVYVVMSGSDAVGTDAPVDGAGAPPIETGAYFLEPFETGTTLTLKVTSGGDPAADVPVTAFGETRRTGANGTVGVSVPDDPDDVYVVVGESAE